MGNSEWNDPEANVLPDKVEAMEANDEIPKNTTRKRVVVVGLGMVGIAFKSVSPDFSCTETDTQTEKSS